MGATTLVVVACVLLLVATLAGYVRRTLLDSDQFANRAAATLQDSSVRSLIAEKVTDELVLRQQADLIAARPLIESAVSTLVGGNAFRSVFVRGVRDVHRAVFNRDQNTLALTLADVGTVAGAAVEKFQPKLAAQMRRQGQVTLITRDLGSAVGDLARLASKIRALAIILAILTLVAALAALLVSEDRRGTSFQLGVGVAITGVVVVIACTVARAIVLARFHDPESRAAAAAVWGVFVDDLRTWGWVLAGSGAIVAAAAHSVLKPIAIEGTLREGWQFITTEPKATWLRVARALGLIALGILIVAAPQTALQVAATLIGVYILYKGVVVVLALIYHPAPEDPDKPRKRPVHHTARRMAVPVLCVAAIAVGLVVFFSTGGASQSAPAGGDTCNGFAELCDKSLEDVVLPATHNSMSAPLPGWFSSEQERPIAGQLADGIRGLLFDTHYGDKLPNGKVRTFFGSESKVHQVASQDGVSPQAVDAALRIRERLGFQGKGVRGMYLCHTFCELGATPLSDGLNAIHDFLATHPDDIVVVINQDYITPADFVKAIGDAGLTQYVFKDFDQKPLPTLRGMIDSNQRLVLMAENHAGAAPWYRRAYMGLTMETPYTFQRNTALLTSPTHQPASCEPNRGPATGAPFFLINHWISTDPIPLPSDAATVNKFGPLLRRARTCERIRHHVVNLLAVNFYKEGDVFRVVDTLNGVGGK
ncbi:MAG TPA: hypothetical protein VH817_17605 [Thermoleophilaceae bacterium]